MYNTVLIKRRLASSPFNTIPVLSGGELAFSEKNNTLYYGAENNVTLTIGGDGAFVTKNSNQTVTGDKSLTGLTTLSSTSFSEKSQVDLGTNKIINVGAPESSTDAATKGYVDDLIGIGEFVDLSTDQDIYGSKTFFDDALFKQNLTITGNLSVLGSRTVIQTVFATTSAISITNTGTGPALEVTQTGSNDIATFYDDVNAALIIKDGGNVGIGTAEPGEKLTVAGSISASEYIFAPGINNLRVTEWGYPGDSAVRLTNALSGESILIQSTDDPNGNEGRSSLRWHIRPDSDGSQSQYSQVDAQNDGIWIKNADWSGAGGVHYWHFDNSGGMDFPNLPGNSRTGNGSNLQFAKSYDQKIISTKQGTADANTVERLVIAGGDSYYNNDTSEYQGEGGDLYLWAGQGYDGGDIKVDAGNGTNGGGTVKVRGGDTTNAYGGFIHLEAGDSQNSNGGEIQIYAGNSSNTNGGYVTIAAGSGTTGGGNVTLQTTQNGTHQMLLSSTGELFVPKSLVATHEGAPLEGFIVDCGTF